MSPSDKSAPSPRSKPRPSVPLPTALGGVLGLLGTIPAVVGLALIAGLVLRRGGEAGTALALGVALIGLPILGLRTLFGRTQWGLLLALWAWPLAVLATSPQLFPGERSSALAEGLSWLAAPMGDESARRGGDLGSQLGSLFGEDPAGRRTTLVQQQPPTSSATNTPALRPLPPVGGLILPFEGGGDSLRVRVTFDGSDYSEELAVLFDTGATITTLDRGALQALGVEIESDAPTARFQTANGEVESPLVLLERVWLSPSVAVEGVTIAVCDDCTRNDGAGLLGLNVTGLFRNTVDHELQSITLEPRSQNPDRRLDLVHWLPIEATATSWPSGRVEVDIQVSNRSNRPVREAVVEIACPESSFTVSLQDIQPGSTRDSALELPRGADCPSYRVMLHSGRW